MVIDYYLSVIMLRWVHEHHIAKSDFPKFTDVCDLQFWQVDARAYKHTTKKVPTLQMNKIHVMGCNQLKDR